MQIPSYAKPHLDAYQSTGTLSGPTKRVDLDKQSANDSLQNMKDEFNNWKALDESEADQLKGQPGAVRVSAASGSGESTEASFSGDTHRGQLTVVENSPTLHYNSVGVTETHFTPKSAESFSVQQGGAGILFGPDLVHVDRELSSDGPVVLSGGPVSVTLTDKATSGYVIYQER